MSAFVLETGVVAPPLCSVNAPLGSPWVFRRWNLGITTRVMMFIMLSSDFYVVLADGHDNTNLTMTV